MSRQAESGSAAGGFAPYPAEYLRGIALFNAGEYFEAHEEVERVWLREDRDSPRRDFYKAFIQMAAAYLKARTHRAAAGRLFTSSRAYFAPYEPWYMGLDVVGVRAAMARAQDRLAETDSEGVPPDSGELPHIVLNPTRD